MAFSNNQRGHSTATMAGRRSAECQAKVLILNHLSPKCESILPRVVQEAYQGSNQQSAVVASFDFMEVVVPRIGFGNHDDVMEEDQQEDKTANQEKDEKKDKIKISSLLSWAKNLL
jgi:hypothetical protein